jgi:hypothetical protein
MSVLYIHPVVAAAPSRRIRFRTPPVKFLFFRALPPGCPSPRTSTRQHAPWRTCRLAAITATAGCDVGQTDQTSNASLNSCLVALPWCSISIRSKRAF